jgi:hypothetical protein
MKKYLFFMLLLCVCCTRAPTEEEIATVTRHQSRLSSYCDKIGVALNGKNQMHWHTQDGPMCDIYLKQNLNNPWVVFYEPDLGSIGRFLDIKDKK